MVSFRVDGCNLQKKFNSYLLFLYFRPMRVELEDTYEGDFGFIEGFDDCIAGMDEAQMRVIYSIPKCITLISRMIGMDSRERASMYFYEFIFNGDYPDINTAPIFMNYPEDDSFAFWLN